MNPEELRKLAAELDEQAKAALKAGNKDEAFRLLRASWVAHDAADEREQMLAKGLPGKESTRTLRTMDIDTRGQSADVKRGAGRATRNHPAQKKFYVGGITIKGVAKELRETRARVSSWMAEGEANRAIPRRYAEYLREKYGVPLSAWARIKD